MDYTLQSDSTGNKANVSKFETLEWSLETADGQKIELLDKTRPDPFKNTALKAEPELQA